MIFALFIATSTGVHVNANQITNGPGAAVQGLKHKPPTLPPASGTTTVPASPTKNCPGDNDNSRPADADVPSNQGSAPALSS